jgi:hypothetical protein
LDCHFPPIKIPPQAENMIEEVVGGGNVVEKTSNRFRMEEIGSHLAEKGSLVYRKIREIRR